MNLKWIAVSLLFCCSSWAAQNQTGRPDPQKPANDRPARPPVRKPPAAEPVPGKGRVVEEIIARVNNEVVTLSDYQRAQATVEEETKQECNQCPAQQLQTLLTEHEKNVLRDLIDQSLLVQRGKDLGFNVEPDVIKRLDQIRQQNNLKDLDELDKKITEQGISPEDFKANIRNSLMTQEVIRREVGSRINIGRDEVQKYYAEHPNEFQRPEQVYLREIFVSTEGKKPEEIPELEKKAKTLLERVRKGEDFAELAKRHSDGSTAKAGGELGVFGRRQLSKEFEDQVFQMNRGQVTEVIRTKTGFEILKVEQRFEAGLQPLDKVEGEIMNRLYSEKMEPRMRSYLQTLRLDSYVVVKPGYLDSGGAAGTSIEEVAATPDEEKKGKGKRSFPLVGKRKKAGA